MKNKESVSFFRWTCALSGICLPALPAAASLRAGVFAGPCCVSAALLCGACILLMLPVSEEGGALSRRFAFAGAAAVTAEAAAGVPARIQVLTMLSLLGGCLWCRAADYYAALWPLFKPFRVWRGVETYARDAWTLLLALLAAAFPGGAAPLWQWLYLPLCAALYALLAVRLRTGHSFFLRRRKELEIKELIRGNLRSTPASCGQSEEELGRMKQLYDRVVSHMEEKRPFLDEGFDLDDLRRAVFSNRAYLSKTINVLSGHNFSQFVNCFRVRYSVELLRKDPALRLIDVAMMSGFHTTVTFNTAFKRNMGETPSRFQERLRTERLSK